jgi:hypothetical protein
MDSPNLPSPYLRTINAIGFQILSAYASQAARFLMDKHDLLPRRKVFDPMRRHLAGHASHMQRKAARTATDSRRLLGTD